jgi:ferredoxin
MMRADIDDDQCKGHGICVSICPEIFTLTDDGYAVAIKSEIPAIFEESAREASQSCPEHAIALR